MPKDFSSNAINSIIGQGAELKGEFKFDGVLRIDGVFSGKLITNGKVIIGKTGVVKNDIKAGTIIIGGTIHGNVYATKQVNLLATGKLYGDIITPSLTVEEGVIFNGHCIINKDGDPDFFKKITEELKNSKSSKGKKKNAK